MARKVDRLSPTGVEKDTKSGMHPDRGDMYLLVGQSGAKRWSFRSMLNGKAHEMGLGRSG